MDEIMNNTINDFIVAAANELTGNISGALHVSGGVSYENFVWNTDLYKGTIPTKDEVMNKAQELFDKEAMRRLRIERDLLLVKTDWVVTKAAETGVAETDAWKEYRQALRDLPLTSTPELDGPSIKNVTWPTIPS
tara:strand:- start:1450 stop:1854 length:405 start_codon:yes stop_codon:yes gene_type:complete